MKKRYALLALLIVVLGSCMFLGAEKLIRSTQPVLDSGDRK